MCTIITAQPLFTHCASAVSKVALSQWVILDAQYMHSRYS